MDDRTPEELFFEGINVEKKAEVKSEPTQPKLLSSRSVFSHPDAHPVVLDITLLKHFNLEWLSWLPDTLFFEIEKTFSTSIAEVNRLKIQAVQTLHVIDTFWEEWEIFEKTIMALNGIIPLPTLMQPPDLSFLYAGVDMANQIRKETFNEEVSRYCAAVFLYENVQYAPEPLEFCQTYIEKPYYECKDCGKKGSAFPPFDGLCTSCAGYFTHDRPFSFKPDPDAVKRGAGKNITLHKLYDSSDVKKRFEEFNGMDAASIHKAFRETSTDIQAAKLITAIDYKAYKAQQLKEQIGSLKGWLEAT
jgi:hypothetical protein